MPIIYLLSFLFLSLWSLVIPSSFFQWLPLLLFTIQCIFKYYRDSKNFLKPMSCFYIEVFCSASYISCLFHFVTILPLWFIVKHLNFSFEYKSFLTYLEEVPLSELTSQVITRHFEEIITFHSHIQVCELFCFSLKIQGWSGSPNQHSKTLFSVCLLRLAKTLYFMAFPKLLIFRTRVWFCHSLPTNSFWKHTLSWEE